MRSSNKIDHVEHASGLSEMSQLQYPLYTRQENKLLILIDHGNDLRLTSNYSGYFERHVMLVVTLYRSMTIGHMVLCHPTHEWIENYLLERIAVGFSAA
jgi:hypothetical protein